MTGFFRDGYCRVGPEDGGNHAVAGKFIKVPFIALFPPFVNSKRRPPSPPCAFFLFYFIILFLTQNARIFFSFSFSFSRITTIGVLTREFLDFSASRGNNLRTIGLEPGCKWCLCTARWKEAANARKGDDDPVVPK